MSAPRIDFSVSAYRIAVADALLLVYAEEVADPRKALFDHIVGQTIATDVEVTIGGVKVTLAMLSDPAHWESDWADAIGADEDVDAWIAAQMVTTSP